MLAVCSSSVAASAREGGDGEGREVGRASPVSQDLLLLRRGPQGGKAEREGCPSVWHGPGEASEKARVLLSLARSVCVTCRFQEAFGSKLNARSGHQALQAHPVSSLHQAKRVGRWGHHTPGKEGDPAEGVPRAPWPRARVSCTPLVPGRPLVSSGCLSKPHPQRPSEEATLPCGPRVSPRVRAGH